MTQETRELLERALRLPPDDRALLLDALHASLDQPGGDDATSPEVQGAWRDEIARRVREYREGKVQAIPADTVHAEVVAELERARARRRTPPTGRS